MRRARELLACKLLGTSRVTNAAIGVLDQEGRRVQLANRGLPAVRFVLDSRIYVLEPASGLTPPSRHS